MLHRKISVNNLNLDVDIYVKNLHDNSDATFFSDEKKLLLAQRSLSWIFEVNFCLDHWIKISMIILEHGFYNANWVKSGISKGQTHTTCL